MTSIGESLRRERLRRNLQLEQISNELKISARMLAAIEAEDFDKLPGGVFTKSFVRQYAHLLGLDEEEMAAEVGRMLDPEPLAENPRTEPSAIPLPRMEAWQSVSDSRGGGSRWSSSLPALMLVVLVMLVCSGIYAFLERPRRAVATNQPAPQAQHSASAAESSPPAQNAPSAQEPQTARAVEPPAATGASPPATAAEQSAAAAKPVENSAASPAAAPAGPPGPVHVELVASEPVWVRIASDGKYVFSGTLEPDQTRTVDANQSVELRLGNAGGVNILLNGKSIGAVGPKGQIRSVQLTSGGFQIVAPPPKSPATFDPL